MTIQGGLDDFEEWYRSQHPALLAALTLLLSDIEEAREVTSHAFSMALERWPDLRLMENRTGWTYVVAVNAARRRWRRRITENEFLEQLRGARSSLSSASDTRLDVWRAIQSLTERGRRAVILRYFGGLSEAEVATAMGVALGTASATLSVARQRLSVVLANYARIEESQ